jgi:type III pantothenate kinase
MKESPKSPHKQNNMKLCIDIGNSMIKTGVFRGSSLISKNNWIYFGSQEIRQLGSDYPQIKNVIISSVRQDDQALNDNLKSHFGHLLVFDENTPIPLTNNYKTGKSLGKDRLAAVIGANNIYPDRNVLVIDAGTAITFDVVDEFNRYLGGNISPGMTLRFRALHEYTGKLPLVGPQQEVPLIAGSTEDAIAAGVQNGIMFEMECYIDRLSERFSELIIIFTGGESKYFDKKLKYTIFADPDLILTGLNRILTYNVENT